MSDDFTNLLPLVSTVDELLGNKTIGGVTSTVRVPRANITNGASPADLAELAERATALESDLAPGSKVGRIGANMASAGTVNLAAATGDFIAVTGNATISSFGTLASGIEQTIYFTGSPLIIHNPAAINLPTGVNMTAAAGDVAIFRSGGGGVWQCVSYLRASGKRLANDPASGPEAIAGTRTDVDMTPASDFAALDARVAPVETRVATAEADIVDLQTFGIRLNGFPDYALPVPAANPYPQLTVVGDTTFPAYSDGTEWRKYNDNGPVNYFAADYHVDSRGSASDAGPGTYAAPWKTMGPVNAVGAGLPNKKLGVARASLFSTTVIQGGGYPGIKVRAEGPGGSPPVFELRSVIDPASWAVDGTYPLLYNTTLAPYTPGTKNNGSMWAAEVMVQQMSTKALAAGTPGRFYVSGWTTANPVLSYRPIGDLDPRTSGVVHKYSKGSIAVELGDSGDIRGIQAIGPAAQDGSLKAVSGSYMEGCITYDANRHHIYMGPNSRVTETKCYGGRNDLESPGYSNSIVFNQPVIAGQNWTVDNCFFDGATGAGLTGPYGHGAVATDVFAWALSQNNVFKDMQNCHDACAADFQIKNPVLLGTVQQLLSGSRIGAGCKVTDLGMSNPLQTETPKLVQLCNLSTGGTFLFKNMTYEVPNLNRHVLCDQVASDLSLEFDNWNPTVTSQASTTVAHLIRHARGTLNIHDCSIGPAVGALVVDMFRAGFNSSAVTYTGARNKWPIGSSFILNGATYANLDALIAAGFEANTSTEQPLPTPAYTTPFTAPDQNLEALAPWHVSGTAAQMAIRSNEVATIGTGLCVYYPEDLASSDMWAEVTLGTIPASAGPGIMLRGLDSLNWINIRWATAGISLQISAAGTLSGGGVFSGSPVPATGGKILAAVRGSTSFVYYKAPGAASYTRVGGAAVLAAGAAGLASNKRAGLVGRATAINPFITDFKCGVL